MTNAISRTLVVGTVGILALMTGCAPPPPDEAALLHYLRNARVNGEARRLWPDGQKYANNVLKSYFALQKELKPLADLLDPLSLWPQGDARWQDEQELTSAIGDLTHLQAEGQLRRQEKLASLEKTVNKTPAGIGLDTPEQQPAFVAKVWEALTLNIPERERIAQLESVLAARLELLRAVLAAKDVFDGRGLKFKDEQTQTRIVTQYAEITVACQSNVDNSLRLGDRYLQDAAERLKKVDKRNQRDEYQCLDNQRKYFRERLEALPRALLAASKNAEEEVKALSQKIKRASDKVKVELEAELAFQNQRATELKSHWESLRTRVTQILDKSAAVTSVEKTQG